MIVAAAVVTAVVLMTGGSEDRRQQVRPPQLLQQTPQTLNPLLRSDMQRGSEVLPNGVPLAYDWATRPRSAPLRRGERYGAFTAWGQLYRCAGRRVSPRDGVMLQDMRASFLRAGGRSWETVQSSSRLEGAGYAEDFDGPTTAPLLLSRSDSATVAGVRPGANFHFWPGPRVSVDSRTLRAVTVTIRAKLAPSSTGRAGVPCFVLSVGGDYWRDVASSGTPRDAGIGRFKRVTRSWRTFTMTTATPRTLARVPFTAASPG